MALKKTTSLFSPTSNCNLILPYNLNVGNKSVPVTLSPTEVIDIFISYCCCWYLKMSFVVITISKCQQLFRPMTRSCNLMC